MRGFADALRRNRRAIMFFVLMVLLPAGIFTVLVTRSLRSERMRADYQRKQRQQDIVRLAEADLNRWLFSTGADGAITKSLFKFQFERDRVVFPDFQLSVPRTESRQRASVTSRPEPVALTAESLAEHYYPRIEAFLRDLQAGRHAGAQYFLRLKALIVRLPAGDRGYALDVQHVLAYLNPRLEELRAGDEFTAALWVPFGDRDSARPPPSDESLVLEGFPFFRVIFSESYSSDPAGIRRYAFAYSTVLLVLVTIAGSVFVHRAVSQEVRLSALKNDFVSAVSHEFRTPLSSILALSERLESARVNDAEQLRQYHLTIGREARRLSDLVTRLLDFAQIEEGRMVYSLERVDLIGIARDAIQSCQHAVRPERVELHGDGPEPLWVRADRTALQHCVQNLIENAGKYSPPDAPVSVTCARAGDAATVEVRDRGIGVPPSERARIFEKFYRGNRATELHVQGVGIGLALVKHVMESHGGRVLVESQPGQGSCFRLLLPRADG